MASLAIMVALGLVAGFVALSLAWRAASRRWTLPCPAALGWTLEGSLADWTAGTSRTLDRMELRPGQKILEVGPGPGRLLIPAAFRILPGGHALGIDLQPKMIERLNTRAKAAGVTNLTTLVGDATRLAVPDESIDLVYLCTVLGEIPNRQAALAECVRVLKRGGTLAVTEILGDPHYQSRSKVRELTQTVGLKPLSIVGNWRMYTARFGKP